MQRPHGPPPGGRDPRRPSGGPAQPAPRRMPPYATASRPLGGGFFDDDEWDADWPAERVPRRVGDPHGDPGGRPATTPSLPPMGARQVAASRPLRYTPGPAPASTPIPRPVRPYRDPSGAPVHGPYGPPYGHGPQRWAAPATRRLAHGGVFLPWRRLWGLVAAYGLALVLITAVVVLALTHGAARAAGL